MTRFWKIPVIVFPLLVFLLLSPGSAPCSEPILDKNSAAKAVNAFAVDLYHQVRQGDGNLIFSPYSISMCLAMAYAGARGNTESQMAKALHVGGEQAKVAEAFKALNAHILSAGRAKGIELNVANALWAEKSYTFRKEYLDSVRANYASASGWPSRLPLVGRLVEFVNYSPQEGLRQVDFKGSPDSARNTINRWVEDQTKSRIKDLFPPGSINPKTRLVLSNAIYFKGFWGHQFKKANTKDEPFHLLNGEDVKVPMMSQTDTFGYTEEGDLQLLEMPYKGADLAMVVVLPSKEKPFAEFEQSLTADKLNTLIVGSGERKVEVYLPKFKMDSGFSLRKTLETLGMIDAFSIKDANFSGMTDGRDLFISGRDLFISGGFHKAFVETNEEGTEAWAGTAFHFQRTGAPPQPVVFRADHPFVFLILHVPTRCILFMGRVTQP
jgi:serpin B